MITSPFTVTQPACILVDCRKITPAVAAAFQRFTSSVQKDLIPFAVCLHGNITKDMMAEGKCCCEEGERTSVQRAISKLAEQYRGLSIGRLHVLADHQFKTRDIYRHSFNQLASKNGITIWTNPELVPMMERKGDRILGDVKVGLLSDFVAPSSMPSPKVALTGRQWLFSLIGWN